MDGWIDGWMDGWMEKTDCWINSTKRVQIPIKSGGSIYATF